MKVYEVAVKKHKPNIDGQAKPFHRLPLVNMSQRFQRSREESVKHLNLVAIQPHRAA